MADEIKERFAVDAQLFEEGKGIFDVYLQGKLVYSKYQTGRFPERGEVTRLIDRAQEPVRPG